MATSKQQFSRQGWLLRLLGWIIVDATVINLAFLTSFSVRALTATIDYRNSIYFVIIATSITIAALYFFRIYRIYWMGTSGHAVRFIFQGTSLAFIIVFFANLFVFPQPIPVSVVILSYILQFGGFVVVRYRSRLIGAMGWRWRAIWHREFPVDNRERVLIIGAGESGQIAAKRLRHHFMDVNYKVIGFIDDDPTKHNMLVENCPILGTTQSIPQIVKEHKIDLLIMAIHNIDGSAFRQILEQCEKTNARVQVIPDMLKMFEAKLSTAFLRDVRPEDIIGRKIIIQHEDIDLDRINGRVVMVTGAAGSIGSELARQIIEFHRPEQLILLDNNESGLFDLEIELAMNSKPVKIVKVLADVTHYKSLEAIFSAYRPQIIFHAAAYKHVPMLELYPNEAIRVNIGGTYNVVNLAYENNAERFVLISSDKAVNPSSVMGASKRICEILIRVYSEQHANGTLFTAVRFGNVLGSRGSVVPTFNRQIDNGGPVTLTDKRMTRYFMSISEAVNLVIHAGAITNGNDIFVLKMGEVVRIYDLAKRMIRLRGLRPDIDVAINITGMRPGEKLYEELTDEFENLDETIHPEIMSIGQYQINGHGADLLNRISNLIKDGVDNENALAVMRSITCEFDSLRVNGVSINV